MDDVWLIGVQTVSNMAYMGAIWPCLVYKDPPTKMAWMSSIRHILACRFGRTLNTFVAIRWRLVPKFL